MLNAVNSASLPGLTVSYVCLGIAHREQLQFLYKLHEFISLNWEYLPYIYEKYSFGLHGERGGEIQTS